MPASSSCSVYRMLTYWVDSRGRRNTGTEGVGDGEVATIGSVLPGQAEIDGIEPSAGSVGASYDNALAETVVGLFKTEAIRRRGPW